MATKIDKATLLAAFASNTSGDIGADRLRDFVESMELGAGGLYTTNQVATSISTPDVFVPTGNTWALDSESVSFDMNAAGRLRYTGGPPVLLSVQCAVSLTVGASSTTQMLVIAKNGTPIAYTEQRVLGLAVGLPVTCTVLGLAPVVTNDEIELKIGTVGGTSDPTVVHAVLTAVANFK